VKTAVIVVALAGTAHAQDQFEIQVYDAATAPRGDPGLELHVNYHAITGAPDQLHTTFEPHYGLADWAELGGYLQTSNAAYAGVKLRLKLRWPRRVWNGRLGFAINGEVSAVPPRFEPDVWGSEVRPIVELVVGRLYAAANPIVSIDLRNGHPDFEPCGKLAAKVTTALSVGAEAYTGPDLTRLYGVVDVTGSWWDLEVAGGWSWGSADHAVVKLIVGFHPKH
jgi:hypothetical protein